jgi:hypothetical protein
MVTVQAKPEEKPVEQQPSGPRVDEKLMKPGKYEVTPETTFSISIHMRARDNRWIIMAGPGKGIDTELVVFRMWTYDEMVEMRKMATSYDQSKRIHMIDNDALNRLKVQRLMVSWTFGKDNPRLRVQHVNGVMTDESWRAFTQLQPNILNYIIDEMNKVYEFNG